MGSFANDPMCDLCVNCQIIQCPACPYAAYIVSGKDLAYGDEAFVSYGRPYWFDTSPTDGDGKRRIDSAGTAYNGYCTKHAQASYDDEEEREEDYK